MSRPQIDVKKISHCGVIAGLFKKFDIIGKIDLLLPKTSNNQSLSHGQVLLAMLMQGFGLESKRLYLAKEYFSHMAVTDFLGPM